MLEKISVNKFGKKCFLLGKKDGVEYWLEDFSWDCGWYWGLGYVETINSHQHFDGLFLANQKDEKGNYIYHINEFLDESVLTDSQAWELSDLFKSCYTLRETAELFGRGSSNYATPSVKIKDEKLAERINKEILPKLFERIRELLTK